MQNVHTCKTHAQYLWATIIIITQDSSLSGQVFFCAKKTDKEDGGKHAMILLVPGYKVLSFPTSHTFSLVDGNHGNISATSEWRSILGEKLTEVTLPPHRCCTSDSRPENAKPRMSQKVLWDLGIFSLQDHQPSKGWLGDCSYTWLCTWSLSRSFGISHQIIYPVFSKVMKRQGTKIKADTQRFYVHSSPLIYWKFQHLRRKKAKSTGILAGWWVIEKRCEFPQNKHNQTQLLHTLSSAVILWLDWHPCQGVKGREMGERHRSPQPWITYKLWFQRKTRVLACVQPGHGIRPGSRETTGPGQIHLE